MLPTYCMYPYSMLNCALQFVPKMFMHLISNTVHISPFSFLKSHYTNIFFLYISALFQSEIVLTQN